MHIWVPFFHYKLVLGFHLQLATNTLERVAPLTHAVGNVLKRVFVIGFSIVVFGNCLHPSLLNSVLWCCWLPWLINSHIWNPAGNKISTQTGIGTAIAIAGVAIYSLIKANLEEQKKVRSLQSLTLSFVSEVTILDWAHIQCIICSISEGCCHFHIIRALA